MSAWKWYWREENGEANCGVFKEDRPGQATSICRAPRYIKREDWESIAPVLSAAPELLEALKIARDHLDILYPDAYGKDAIVTAVHDAIAKAEGGK